jgi:hypothetical protein
MLRGHVASLLCDLKAQACVACYCTGRVYFRSTAQVSCETFRGDPHHHVVALALKRLFTLYHYVCVKNVSCLEPHIDRSLVENSYLPLTSMQRARCCAANDFAGYIRLFSLIHHQPDAVLRCCVSLALANDSSADLPSALAIAVQAEPYY